MLRGVCEISYLYTATCGPKGHGSGLPLPSRTAAGSLYITLSWPKPTTVSSSRVPLSPVPQSARQKRERLNDKGKKPIPSSPGQGNKNVEGYDPGGPGPPSSPSPPEPVLTPASSSSLRSTLKQPTLVSLRNASTASVDFSFHNHLPEGALGCFHSWAFPISFHSRLICGLQALHSVKRRWRVCLPPPHHQHRSSSVLWILCCGVCYGI